jgi:hypothetical protein
VLNLSSVSTVTTTTKSQPITKISIHNPRIRALQLQSIITITVSTHHRELHNPSPPHLQQSITSSKQSPKPSIQFKITSPAILQESQQHHHFTVKPSRLI